jgi:hypothetical protein
MVSAGSQARRSMGLDRALPGAELDRQFVATAVPRLMAPLQTASTITALRRATVFGVRRRQVDDCAVDPRQDRLQPTIP